ncbi:MAG: hypothetical protein J0L91_08335 [Burkholderiales bacterium]|nr:hypothetical protein [Burkholderiales bacterium]
MSAHASMPIRPRGSTARGRQAIIRTLRNDSRRSQRVPDPGPVAGANSAGAPGFRVDETMTGARIAPAVDTPAAVRAVGRRRGPAARLVAADPFVAT